MTSSSVAELLEPPVRNAIHELRTYFARNTSTALRYAHFECGKRVFARLDAGDDDQHYFSRI